MRQPETSPECAPGVWFIAHCDRGCCKSNEKQGVGTGEILVSRNWIDFGGLNPVGHKGPSQSAPDQRMSPVTSHQWRWVSKRKHGSSFEAEGFSGGRE